MGSNSSLWHLDPLICEACQEEPKARLENGRLGKMCAGCQRDYDDNRRAESVCLCWRCRQVKHRSEFAKNLKACRECCAKIADLARESVRQPTHEDSEQVGITDEDIRTAYMKLYHGYKNGGLLTPRAMVGPAIDILVAIRSAEAVSADLYQITDYGITVWAYEVTKTSGRYDIDHLLMRKANWIMSIRTLLEQLHDSEWHVLDKNVSYDTRKEAKENAFVEIQGATVSRKYKITAKGLAELARLRAEAGATPQRDGERTEKEAVMNHVREALSRGRALASTAKPQPVMTVAAAPRVLTKTASDRMEALTNDDTPASTGSIVGVATASDESVIVAAPSSTVIGTTYAIDWKSLAESRAEELKNRLIEIENLEKLNGVLTLSQKAVHEMRVADGKEDLTLEDYVEQIRQKLADDVAYIADLIGQRDHETAIVDLICQMAAEDGEGEKTPIEYVEGLRDTILELDFKQRLLDELSKASRDVRQYVEARLTAEASLAAIVKNGTR